MFEKTVHMTFSTEIGVNAMTLFDFHADTDNLPKITPPWITARLVSLKLPLYEGRELELDISRFGLTQRWKIQIAELNPFELICDKALKSPFSSFSHHHRFKMIGENRTLLCDELEFSLPFYPFSLIAMPFIKRDIRMMFEYRHLKTKTLLENNNV